MKWNIFERLNTLEKELHELREVVRYQGNTIISLQLNDIEKEGEKTMNLMQLFHTANKIYTLSRIQILQTKQDIKRTRNNSKTIVLGEIFFEKEL